jgi:hypothetical protein
VHLHQWWEYNPKKKLDRPRVDLIPVENMRIAPGADWVDPINTSPYLIHKIPMFVKDVLAKMEDAGDKAGTPTWKKVEPANLLKAINAYSDSTRLTRERGRTDSKEAATSVNEFALVWVHRNIIDWEGEDWVYYTLGRPAAAVRPREAGGACAASAGARTSWALHPRDAQDVPDGVSRHHEGHARRNQRQLANLRIDNVRFALNKRFFGKRGAQIDLRSLTRNVPGSVTLMNDPRRTSRKSPFRTSRLQLSGAGPPERRLRRRGRRVLALDGADQPPAQ